MKNLFMCLILCWGVIAVIATYIPTEYKEANDTLKTVIFSMFFILIAWGAAWILGNEIRQGLANFKVISNDTYEVREAKFLMSDEQVKKALKELSNERAKDNES